MFDQICKGLILGSQQCISYSTSLQEGQIFKVGKQYISTCYSKHRQKYSLWNVFEVLEFKTLQGLRTSGTHQESKHYET